MLRRWLTGFLLCVCTGCAPTTATTEAHLPGSVGGGPTIEPRVPWSPARPLAWTDFRAVPPSEGVEGAHTVYVLSYESRCRGDVFHFAVTAVFLPTLSWVKRSVADDPSESARVLNHEQTHFNLTEVYARRMRRYFAEMYDPCRRPEDEVRTEVDRFVTEEAAAQTRYDDETRFGLTVARQQAWDREVADLLRSLEPFARP